MQVVVKLHPDFGSSELEVEPLDLQPKHTMVYPSYQIEFGDLVVKGLSQDVLVEIVRKIKAALRRP